MHHACLRNYQWRKRLLRNIFCHIKNKLKWDKNVSKCCMVYCIWQKELQTIFGYTRVNAIKSRLKDSVSSQVLIPSYITKSHHSYRIIGF